MSVNLSGSYFYHQYYVDQGEGDVVVVLHGLFSNLGRWMEVVNNASENFRVIIPRLPIFEGRSTSAIQQQLIDNLHEFITHHQLTNVTIMGTSSAGYLAMKYADEYSENVKRIIITGRRELTASGINYLTTSLRYEKLQTGFSD